MNDHYFTADPASAPERRSISVRLGGRDLRVETAAGVFSPDRIDIGTSVLLREVPSPPAEGDLLDLGCGWGPLALTMGLESPGARVWALDVNRRALDLLARNATAAGITNVRAVTAADVPDGLTFSGIWSNPPIRVGKAVLHELLATWLPRLAPGGSAYLVVQKNLGADSLHTWLTATLGTGFEVGRHASAKGFRVLSVRRTDAPPPATPA